MPIVKYVIIGERDYIYPVLFRVKVTSIVDKESPLVDETFILYKRINDEMFMRTLFLHQSREHLE